VLHLSILRERLRLSLWFVPAIFAVAATVLAFALVAVDRSLAASDGGFFRFGGTAEGARSVLSTIAQSMLTFTGLVFSITMLVLQLASSQLSPRVMRTFLRDRKNQAVLGLFVATFVYTLLVLREVRGPEAGEPFVPGVSIWVAFVFLLASVAAFIYYIDHMAHAIRASTVIERIGDETREAIERLYPEGVAEEPAVRPRLPDAHADDALVEAPHHGSLVDVDEAALRAIAEEAGVVVELLPVVGDFLPAGAPLVRLRGRPQPEAGELASLRDRIGGAVTLGTERTLHQDAAFGFRQLVDVGTRALSPGTNDPTTAIQALDQLHDLLRRLATRDFPSEVRVDEAGRPILVMPRLEWADYVHLALDEIRRSGEGQLQVARRLAAILEDLLTVCPPERTPVLRDQLARLGRSVERGFTDPGDRATASHPSARGHGPS